MRPKQISRVYEAVVAGCRTTHEVQAATGLPYNHCSTYLSVLRHDAVLRIAGRRRFNPLGVACYEYVLASSSGARTFN
jgi:hypothetical protein